MGYLLSVDPAERRIAELASKLADGTETAADREELALYAEENPQITALVRQAEVNRDISGADLSRARADQQLVASENTGFIRTERRIGVALVVAGTAAGFVAPPAFLAAVAGAGILLWSIVRTAVKNSSRDPYKDIEQ